MNTKQHDVFMNIHRNLPREGPGSAAATRQALSLLTELPERPRILDVGCGPGMQTMELASRTDARIVAVDLHRPYLDLLVEKVKKEGLSDRIEVREGDLFALDFPPSSFDVIWAEGSIYIIGFERGLREWSAFLKDGGYLAVSELTWLQQDAPRELKDFWLAEYPAMRDIPGNLETLTDCGLEAVGHFPLPASAFWDDYYTPLEARLARLEESYAGDREALEVIDLEKAEIELFRKYSEYYSYVFYIGRRYGVF